MIIANSAETTIIPDVIITEVTSQPGGSVTNLYVNSKTQILLQTARVRVSRADNQNHEINARVLFDSGSQRSYVKLSKGTSASRASILIGITLMRSTNS